MIDTRKKRWRAFCQAHRAAAAAYRAAEQRYISTGGMTRPPSPPVYPKLPDDLCGLPCGAKTRVGGACKRTDIYENGRCKFHGGLSTGPKTPEGKARALATLKRRLKRDDGIVPT